VIELVGIDTWRYMSGRQCEGPRPDRSGRGIKFPANAHSLCCVTRKNRDIDVCPRMGPIMAV
jgi:hypothetical protein